MLDIPQQNPLKYGFSGIEINKYKYIYVYVYKEFCMGESKVKTVLYL